MESPKNLLLNSMSVIKPLDIAILKRFRQSILASGGGQPFPTGALALALRGETSEL